MTKSIRNTPIFYFDISNSSETRNNLSTIWEAVLLSSYDEG